MAWHLLICWINLAVSKSTGAIEASYMDIVRFAKRFILSPIYMEKKSKAKLGHSYFEIVF